MVETYIILANSNDNKLGYPRQLVEINGEKLIERTIRLLKENGIKDIIITAKDERFDSFGVKRYEPLNNDYDYKTGKGYWLNAFPQELLYKPVCFIWGDVYFSEEAISTIVQTETDSTLFFCSYNNKSTDYIKQHDEPFAYKVVDTELFKNHIEKVKKLYDEGKTVRHPIIWEVYRSINEIDINTHELKDNCVIINDITCDIDSKLDVDKLKLKFNTNINKKLSIVIAYYNTFELTKNMLNILIPQLNDDVEVILVDDGCKEVKLDIYKDKIKIIHLEENKGGAYACNEAIRHSHGKYIGYIDSDDMIAEDYVETLLTAIDNNDKDVIFMDWQDMVTKNIVKRPNNYAQWKAIYRRNTMPMFVEGRRYSYDVPFYEELNSKEYTRYYLDKVLYYYNSGRPDNLTHKKKKIIEKQKAERRNKMVRAEVTEVFTLEKFNELKDIKRKSIEEEGKLFIGDTFICNEEMAEYLTVNNKLNRPFVKVIEVIPEKGKQEIKTPIKKETKSKKTIAKK